jgi:hypothetical protein
VSATQNSTEKGMSLITPIAKADRSGKVSEITGNDTSNRFNTTVWVYSDTRDLELKWRVSADTTAVPVGIFRLDLKGLLEAGHCTPAGKKIRFNIYHDEDRWLRVRDKRADGGGTELARLDW